MRRIKSTQLLIIEGNGRMMMQMLVVGQEERLSMAPRGMELLEEQGKKGHSLNSQVQKLRCRTGKRLKNRQMMK